MVTEPADHVLGRFRGGFTTKVTWPASRARNLPRSIRGHVGGDSAEVHPAGAMLDEYQDVQSSEQHGVHVQEVDGDDLGGLGVQELPPGRA